MSNIWWIQCKGNRTFIIDNILCIKYSSHYFIGIFLGLFAIDKFSLGHIGVVVVGKIITLVQAKRNFFDFFYNVFSRNQYEKNHDRICKINLTQVVYSSTSH